MNFRIAFLTIALMGFMACDSDEDLKGKVTECKVMEQEIVVFRKNPRFQGEIVRKGTSRFIYENDKLIRVNSFDERDELNAWFIYAYTEEGNLDHTLIHDVFQNKTDTIEKYEYDEEGRINRMLLYNMDTISQLERTISYPTSSTLLLAFEGNEYEYTLDDKGNLIKVFQTKFGPLSGPYLKTHYNYDNGKNPYQGIPAYELDVLRFFSPNNFIAAAGTIDSTQAVDRSEVVFLNDSMRYNNFRYPIEIVKDGRDTYERTTITYSCD